MSVLNDGHSTTIDLTGAGVIFKEKEVTPPSLDAGGPNDTTTMRNNIWRTRQPKKLVTMDKATVKVAYDVIIYQDLVTAVLGVNRIIIITFPDTHTLTFWGWLDKFTPDAIKEGEQPSAEIEIVCSNQDNDGNEVDPTYA